MNIEYIATSKILRSTYFRYDIFDVYSLDDFDIGDKVNIYTCDKGYVLARHPISNEVDTRGEKEINY